MSEEPDWWNLEDPSFGLNRRFQTELKAALTEYVEDATFWISEAYEDDGDPDYPGGLQIHFATGPDDYLRKRKSILELLQDFVRQDTMPEWYKHRQPGLERAKRLIAAWDAPNKDDPT